MVQALVDGLPAHGIALHHVNLGLSRDATDIGRWRPGKLFSLLAACGRTVTTRFRHDCDTLYYVPAPGKRGAIYRDWVVMLLCRPFFPRLLLHWHAAGLGTWLATKATTPERWLTRLFLGRADLSIVLGENLRDEARQLQPRHVAIVRNGITDPCPGLVRVPAPRPEWREAVFLGLGIREKGLFDAAEAVLRANLAKDGPRWRLSAAGDLPDPVCAREFADLTARSNGAVRHLGFVTGAAKHSLLSSADALVFPTYYDAETQGLVVAEALAYDLPVIVSNWRAVAENLPVTGVHVVAPRAIDEIAAALSRIGREASPPMVSRQYFLAHYTIETFLARLAAVLTGFAGR